MYRSRDANPGPGWGPVILQGPHPVAGYGGGELNIQNPRVWGIFWKIPWDFGYFRIFLTPSPFMDDFTKYVLCSKVVIWLIPHLSTWFMDVPFDV